MVLAAPPAGAQELQCRTLRGPCTFLDTIAVLLPPGDGAPVLVANFGLVAADEGGRLRFSCEAGLGGLAARSRISPAGAIFVAGDQGLMRYQRGCGGRMVGGELAGRAVLDLAFDPSDGTGAWALGLTPRALYLSGNGGATFTPGWQFPDGQNALAVLAAPSRPGTVYAAGDRAPDGRLLVVRSDDGGRTFGPPPDAVPDGIPLELLGVDPSSADSLFVALRAADGSDAIWRSTDGGRSFTRSLALPPGEVLGGFTFGAGALYAAGRAQLYDPGAVPAHLFVSRDGGSTWGPAIPSGPDGPRYRCLAFRGGRLYACAGGAVNDDAFLLGVSSDGGKSWSGLMTTQALAGPEPCLRSACAATDQWLCDTYALCGGDAGAPPADGSAAAPPSGGCHCAAAASRPPAVALWLPALLLARATGCAARLRRKRERR
jgi:hypothetical protein